MEDKKKRNLIFAIIGAGLLLLLGFAAFLALRQNAAPGFSAKDNNLILFAQDGNNLLWSKNLGILRLEGNNIGGYAFSNDGGIVYYGVPDGSSSTAKEDIYRIDMHENSIRKLVSQRIARGVSKDWVVSSDGQQCLYQNGGLYCYDAKRGTADKLFAGKLIAAADDGTVFSWQAQGNRGTLYRAAFGHTPLQVSANVTEYSWNANLGAVLYTVAGDDASKSLYIVKGNDAAPISIATDVSEVLTDFSAVRGNNIYFLKTGDLQDAPKIDIDDPSESSDAAIQKPNRDDYLSGLFTQFLGDMQYQLDLDVYNEKRARDELRNDIARILADRPIISGQQELYAYDGTATHFLTKINGKEQIYAYAESGSPAVTYRKQETLTREPKSKYTLHELADIKAKSGQEGLEKALGGAAAKTVQSGGIYLAALHDGEATENTLELTPPREKFAYQFTVNPLLLLYAEYETGGSSVSVYTYTITNGALSQKTLLDTGVNAPDQWIYRGETAPGFWYSKTAAGDTKSGIYATDGTTSQKLLDVGAIALTANNGQLLAYQNFDFSGANASGDLFLCTRDSGSIHVAENAAKPLLGENRVYYLANWNKTAASGDLSIFHNGQIELIAEGVSRIFGVYEADKQ
jgi:hypothetical protein